MLLHPLGGRCLFESVRRARGDPQDRAASSRAHLPPAVLWWAAGDACLPACPPLPFSEAPPGADTCPDEGQAEPLLQWEPGLSRPGPRHRGSLAHHSFPQLSGCLVLTLPISLTLLQVGCPSLGTRSRVQPGSPPSTWQRKPRAHGICRRTPGGVRQDLGMSSPGRGHCQPPPLLRDKLPRGHSSPPPS